jgi:hypothetical protein
MMQHTRKEHMKDSGEKLGYFSPQLVCYGAVGELTQNGGTAAPYEGTPGVNCFGIEDDAAPNGGKPCEVIP